MLKTLRIGIFLKSETEEEQSREMRLREEKAFLWQENGASKGTG